FSKIIQTSKRSCILRMNKLTAEQNGECHEGGAQLSSHWEFSPLHRVLLGGVVICHRAESVSITAERTQQSTSAIRISQQRASNTMGETPDCQSHTNSQTEALPLVFILCAALRSAFD